MDTILLIFWIFTATQICYLLLFLLAFVFYRSTDETDNPPVSVIIAARNAIKTLPALLEKLLNQDYPKYEIIVSDDRSSDGTFEQIHEIAKSDHKLRIVRLDEIPDHINGKKFAITMGIKAAKNDHILLTDADCIPDSNLWIKKMAAGFSKKNKQIVLGYSQYFKVKGFLNYFIRFETLFTAIQYISMAVLKKPYMGVGRNLAYTKSIFIDTKGFKGFQTLNGGDDDLFVNKNCTSGNTSIVTGKEALVHSFPKKTWKEFYYQKVRHLNIGKYYKFSDRIILGIFTFSLIGSWFTFIPLLILNYQPYTDYLIPILIKISLFYLLFIIAARRLGDNFNSLGVVFLEIFYIFYFVVTGFNALTTKKVKWI